MAHPSLPSGASMRYFECHVTMTGDPKIIRQLVAKLKWKFSVIDGDILLGDGAKCYATHLFNERMGQEEVMFRLKAAAMQLKAWGCTVIRRKAEMVIYDDRSSKMRCEGGCIECHLDDVKKAP